MTCVAAITALKWYDVWTVVHSDIGTSDILTVEVLVLGWNGAEVRRKATNSFAGPIDIAF